MEAEQKTGVEDALASPTAAATFEEPPSEAEVWLISGPFLYAMQPTGLMTSKLSKRPEIHTLA